jgi:hypothetical protein
MKECQLADLEMPNSIALTPTPCDGNTGRGGIGGDADVEMIVRHVTDAVMQALGAK